MYTANGRKLTKSDYKPLRRYCLPHQIRRDADESRPTVMVDNDLSIAAPLLAGEGGMFAYWPTQESYPMTWSSWLVTEENEDACKIMAAALRKVCRYANAINSMVSDASPTEAQANSALKEGGQVVAEWKNARPMLQYLVRTSDPKEIAKMIMEEYTARQVVVLASMLTMDGAAHPAHVQYTAARKFPGRLRFTTKSGLWQMLREQTSEQYETKFLYTKPPEYRSSWQLTKPMEEKW